jgi:hypothetical protein
LRSSFCRVSGDAESIAFRRHSSFTLRVKEEIAEITRIYWGIMRSESFNCRL